MRIGRILSQDSVRLSIGETGTARRVDSVWDAKYDRPECQEEDSAIPSYRIVSADDHVVERPDLWSSRMEARLSDQAPEVGRFENGGDWWTWQGHKVVPVVGGIQVGTRFENQEKLTLSGNVDAVRRGGYIPDEHIKDMEIDGIDVSIVYPTSALSMYKAPIPGDVLDAVFAAYNDWAAEMPRPPNRTP